MSRSRICGRYSSPWRVAVVQRSMGVLARAEPARTGREAHVTLLPRLRGRVNSFGIRLTESLQPLQTELHRRVACLGRYLCGTPSPTMIFNLSLAFAFAYASSTDLKAMRAPNRAVRVLVAVEDEQGRPAKSLSMFGQSYSSRMPGITLLQSSRHTLALTIGSPRSLAAASCAA